MEHSMVDSMLEYDKKIREMGPLTPSKKDMEELWILSLIGRTPKVQLVNITT